MLEVNNPEDERAVDRVLVLLHKRLLGIAKSEMYSHRLLRELDENMDSDIAGKVFDTIVSHLSTPYLRVAVRHAIITELRRLNRAIPASILSRFDDEGNEIEIWDQISQPDVEDPSDPPPLCVIEKRLEILYAGAHSKPHELVAYAYNKHLGWTPSRITEILGQMKLGDAAAGFVARYAETSDIPVNRVQRVFKGLLASANQPAHNVTMAELWNLSAMIDKWTNEPADTLAQSVVRILHDVGWDNSTIITNSDKTLEQLTVEVIRNLNLGDEANRTLQSYWPPPPLACAHWVDAVSRRFRSALHHQERLGLMKITRYSPSPWKTMCFLEMHVFRTPAGDVVRLYSGDTLESMEQKIRERYRAHYRAVSRHKNKSKQPNVKPREESPLDPATVKVWFEPLRRQIETQVAGALTLGSLIRQDETFIDEESSVVAHWRSQVLPSLLGQFGCHDPDTVLFAWRVQLMR